MVELSVTVTVGEGSEQHNHDLDYRSTLSHVHQRPEGVIELIPYRPYKEQINEAMRPFIDEYNARVDARYQAAWERYNAGQIKTKPRRRDFKKMGYDYFSEHLEDKCRNPRTGKVEELPMWRSIIIGIGDMEDRQAGRISEAQARKIMKAVVKAFREDFPDMLLLGATLHLDEEGFYHVHLDYKPLYQKENTERGLDVGIGHDAALEHMGYKPEQSIINGRDKVPILFNAMRNKIYYRMEAAMAAEGLRLQYGVSRKKDPSKDSSRNQSLENWQATQDAARSMQHKKNLALEILENDDLTPAEVSEACKVCDDISFALEAIEKSPRSRLDKNKLVVEYRLFDQLKSLVRNLLESVVKIINDRNYYRKMFYEYRDELNSAGKIFSKYEWNEYNAEQQKMLQNRDATISRLEAELRRVGVPQERINQIKGSGPKPSQWGS